MNARRMADEAAFLRRQERRIERFFSVPGWDDGLASDKQRAFVRHFIGGPITARFNATKAARAAGYRWPRQQGFQLVHDPRISRAIDRAFRRLHPEAARLEPRLGR